MNKQKFLGVGAIALLMATVPAIIAAQMADFPFAHPAFERVWARTDSLVADGTVARTWFWGPKPLEPRIESWEQATGGQRLVQYFDKSRMELNDPGANPLDPFFVTNGLLTVELISGQMQTGTARYENRYPANIPMSGDPGDTTTPTYATFLNVSNTNRGDHFAPDRRNQPITATIDRNGTVGEDAAKANVPNTSIVYFEAQTQHNIPRVFWDFLNQTGPVREAGITVQRPLIQPWFYASGLPISEAYWTRSLVRGQVIDVLIQAYQRRVLTYTPTNSPGFQVEMGNIGQHYYNWRYKFAGQPGEGTGTPFQTPLPGSPTVIPTAVSGSPTVQTSPQPGRSPTAEMTMTAGPTVTGGPGLATATPAGTMTTPKPTESVMPSPTPTSAGVPQPIPVTPTAAPGMSPMPTNTR